MVTIGEILSLFQSSVKNIYQRIEKLINVKVLSFVRSKK